MLLLVNVELTNPPTSLTSFRTLTLIAKLYCNFEVLLEANQNKDYYYKFLKSNGCFDYVEDIVNFGEEVGLRIDNELRYAPTYITDRICPDNLNSILNYLGWDLKKSRVHNNDTTNKKCPWCGSDYYYSFEDTEKHGEFVNKKTLTVFTCKSNDRPWQSISCKQKINIKEL